jgi:hypothetical protein
MKLPYLKNKVPRVAKTAPEEKLVQGSPEDYVEDHCLGELFEACEEKDPKKFRQALEVLVMNLFDWDGENNAG